MSYSCLNLTYDNPDNHQVGRDGHDQQAGEDHQPEHHPVGDVSVSHAQVHPPAISSHD